MLININTHDGLTFKGQLLLPQGDGAISKLIIAIGGAGPSTYRDNFPAELCTEKGMAYFSYNKRGVDVIDGAPYFAMEPQEYKTYLPSNSIKDICSIIETIKGMERFSDCRILLNGWSEGAAIAPLFASKYPEMVEALFLCGYSNVNMKDLQIWQCSKIENGKAMFDECFKAIENRDNEWLMSRMGLTAEWFSESYQLQSNKDLLPTLDLPIYIFNGALDGYCDVEGVYEIRDVFSKLGKTNLVTNVFDNLGHGLDDSSSNEVSEGIKALVNAFYNV